MLLTEMTAPEVADYFSRSGLVIIPAGSLEQHGPEGLVGTDAICAETVAVAAAEQGGWMVAPSFQVGVAPFNMAFPGTVTIRPSVMMDLALDYLRSLMRQGATHVVFLNGHGGNVAPLRSAIHELQTEHAFAGSAEPLIRCRLRNWWDLPACNALRQEFFGNHEGMHGTPSEFSIVMAARPESRQSMEESGLAPLDPGWMRDHAGDAHEDANRHRDDFPDGLVGSEPGLANAAAGERLIAAAAADLAAEIEAFMLS